MSLCGTAHVGENGGVINSKRPKCKYCMKIEANNMTFASLVPLSAGNSITGDEIPKGNEEFLPLRYKKIRKK